MNPPPRAPTPIVRWRWRVLAPGSILHAVEADPGIAGGQIVWMPACRRRSSDTFVEHDGSERCLACFQELARG